MNIEVVDAAMTDAQRQRRDEIGVEMDRVRESFHSTTATYETRKKDLEIIQALGLELGDIRRKVRYDMNRKAAVKA